MAPANEPLADRAVVQRVADQARGFWKADLEALLAAARAAVVGERRGTGLLESVVPWFFEAQDLPRGEESADGPVTHGYDEHGRIVLITEPRPLGRRQFTVFDYDADEVDPGPVQYVIQGDDANRTLERVALLVRPPDSELLIQVGVRRRGQWVAYLWRQQGSRVAELQIWDSGWSGPETVLPEYDSDGTLRQLSRAGRVVWNAEPAEPAETAGGAFPDGVQLAAQQTLRVVRARLKDEKRPVLLLTVCFEWENPEYLPPPIGVVFEEDAEFFQQVADGIPDGIDALLNPTLQEDYDFPSGVGYPYIAGIPEAGLGLPWQPEAIEDNVLRLVAELNAERQPGEPVFLALDLEGEAGEYLDRLPAVDREILASYGI
jgi:hypothetical protein